MPAHQCSSLFYSQLPSCCKKIARPKFFARASGEAVLRTLVKKFFRACLQSSATRGAENKKSKDFTITIIKNPHVFLQFGPAFYIKFLVICLLFSLWLQSLFLFFRYLQVQFYLLYLISLRFD